MYECLKCPGNEYRNYRFAEQIRTEAKEPDPDYDPTLDGIKQEGNTLEGKLNLVNQPAYSLDDLMSQHNYDPEHWEVTSQKHRAWQTPMKDKDTGQILQVTNHYVAFTAVKTKLEAVEYPLLQPFEPTLTKPIAEPKESLRDYEMAVLIGDTQHGYRRDMSTGYLNPMHDRQAIDVALQLCQFIQPQTIGFMGDNLDLAEMSLKYPRTPDVQFTSQAAIFELGWTYAQFRMSCPEAWMFQLEGNHDARFRTAMVANMVGAVGLDGYGNDCEYNTLSLPYMLGLHKIQMHYSQAYPDGEVWLNDYIRAIHGVSAKNKSGDTAKHVLSQQIEAGEMFSTIQGHIHRDEFASQTVHSRDGQRRIFAGSMGSMCKNTGEVPGVKAKQNWQQSIWVLCYQEHSPLWSLEVVPIINGEAMYRGRLFKGNFDTRTLAEEVKIPAFLERP